MNSCINIATSTAHRLPEISGFNVAVFNNKDLMAEYPDMTFLDAFEVVDKKQENRAVYREIFGNGICCIAK